jgi:hypothetical protein
MMNYWKPYVNIKKKTNWSSLVMCNNVEFKCIMKKDGLVHKCKVCSFVMLKLFLIFTKLKLFNIIEKKFKDSIQEIMGIFLIYTI